MNAKQKGVAIHLVVACMAVGILTAVLNFVYVKLPSSDVYVHAHILEEGRLDEVSYPLWHYTVALFYNGFNLSLDNATIAACSFYGILFAAIIWIFMYLRLSKAYSLWVIDIMPFLLCIVQPLYLKIILPFMDIGRSSTNPHHNPTQNAMRPMALAATIFTIALWTTSKEEFFEIKGKKINKKLCYRILLAVLVLLSVLAKPSFAQIYYFAFVLVLGIRFIKSKGKALKECIYDGLCLVPSCIPFLSTYFTYFGNSASEQSEPLGISFLEVWSIYTDSVPLSILAALAFCIVAAIFLGRHIWQYKAVIFSWLMTAIGILEYMFILESGDRYYHGNFSWGYQIGCSLLWIFSVQAFLQELYLRKHENKKGVLAWEIVAGILVLWHLLSGVRDILLDLGSV